MTTITFLDDVLKTGVDRKFYTDVERQIVYSVDRIEVNSGNAEVYGRTYGFEGIAKSSEVVEIKGLNECLSDFNASEILLCAIWDKNPSLEPRWRKIEREALHPTVPRVRAEIRVKRAQ